VLDFQRVAFPVVVRGVHHALREKKEGGRQGGRVEGDIRRREEREGEPLLLIIT
jgi:hypothetical protein